MGERNEGIAGEYHTGYTNAMKMLLKILSVLMVWAVVGYIIFYVDPETIKDVGLPGSYAPFVVSFAIAAAYSILIVTHSFILSLVITVFATLAIALAIARLMTTFTGIIILLLIIFSFYIHFRRDSISGDSVSKSDEGVR